MSTEQTAVIDNISLNEWHRLSPIAIVYFIVKFTLRFVKEGIQSALPAIAVFIASVDNKLFWLSITLPVILTLIVILSAIYWWFYRFRIQGHDILVEQGVISKQLLNLDFSKVQNVNIGVPFYFKPFALVNCIFDSAGSSKSEVNLPGVSAAFANGVRDAVFAYKQHQPKTTNDEPLSQAETNETAMPILSLPQSEVAKYGLANWMALIFLAALMPFIEKIGDFAGAYVIPSFTQLTSVLLPDVLQAKMAAVGILMLMVVVLSFAISMAVSWLKFYDFQLFDESSKLTRFMGLLERNQMSCTKQKVQSIEIRQNIIARCLKRVTLVFRQLSSSHAQFMLAQKDMLVPMLGEQQWQGISQRVFATQAGQLPFTAVHKAYVRRIFCYFWLIPIGTISAVFCFLSDTFMPLLWATLPLLMIGFGLVCLSYKRMGLWFDDEYCAMRSGRLGYKISLFPLYKIQQVRYRQSPGMRRLGLGTLDMVVASGTLSMPYVPLPVIFELMDRGLYLAESQQRDWM
ncbi:PH domain-containing protein [Alteromonadaceae bacterium BrNp21-10]|nr:PH domain-containing protein [Alteromonadaceae bacterium BrNp21-10]